MIFSESVLIANSPDDSRPVGQQGQNIIEVNHTVAAEVLGTVSARFAPTGQDQEQISNCLLYTSDAADEE